MPINKLKAVLAEFDKSNVAEMKYEDADFCVTLKRSTSSTESSRNDSNENWILSPLVGKYYGTKIKKGQRIAAGQVLCIIESMKIMNKICAPADLIVKNIKHQDGDLVELDSRLIEVEYV
jgi:acetyl-CoA carboxylase biotin carboxyl carrier protein